VSFTIETVEVMLVVELLELLWRMFGVTPDESHMMWLPELELFDR
jgi:hypothetical protein